MFNSKIITHSLTSSSCMINKNKAFINNLIKLGPIKVLNNQKVFNHHHYCTLNHNNKKIGILYSNTSLNRQFHTSHVPRKALIASSKFQMNFTRDLFTYCLILSGFLIWIWWWDPRRDGIYYQILNSKDLDGKTWEEILQCGNSKTVKLNGKVLLKYQNNTAKGASFNVKPLESNPRSLEEIILIHYFLTCYKVKRTSRESPHYETHNFYLIRNRPLVVQFIDPTDSNRQVSVDFYWKDNLIGLNSEIVQKNETLTHLKKERVISGNLLQKFFENVNGIVVAYNTVKEPNGLIWHKKETEFDQHVQEYVLRNGNVSFIEGQFKTGSGGKLEFHCSLISHEPEQVLMQKLKDEMRWYEKLSLKTDNWFSQLSKLIQ